MERIHPREYRRSSRSDFNDLLVVENDPVTCDASDHLKARLVKAVRLLRLYDAGRLPLPVMRALDRMNWEVQMDDDPIGSPDYSVMWKRKPSARTRHAEREDRKRTRPKDEVRRKSKLGKRRKEGEREPGNLF